ncbi:hypothetical protein TSAR_006342 [Trichomalopsis sarcophagae]|uniref:Uncharacterized protein n=1 Tax=Trichomalopsis sarcophagae TaxID=543379 RepID=A0A232FLI0_9HYME|nr:hypothetical protein TSAR_006342 [Trichomalopsis sarcophagae]
MIHCATNLTLENCEPSYAKTTLAYKVKCSVCAYKPGALIGAGVLIASGKSEQFLKPANTISKSSNNLHYKILTSTNSSKPKPKIVPSIALSKRIASSF